MSSAQPSLTSQVIELSVRGMDCTECSQHVQHALAAVPGVESVTVLLSSEKAVLRLDPTQVPLEVLQQAVKDAGYAVAEPSAEAPAERFSPSRFTRPVLTLFGLLVGAILLIVVAGEWLGFFERVTEVVPWPVGVALVLVAGAPIFWTVLRAALRRQILSHTLMSLGVVAALAVGQWPTAAVVVFFMHTGTFVESFTTERSRRALKHLTSLVPTLARVEQQGEEREVPVEAVQIGDLVIVRPGEAMTMAVLAGQVHIEAMVCVFDGRHTKPRGAEQGQQRDHESRLAAAGPANDTENFQAASFTVPGRRHAVAAHGLSVPAGAGPRRGAIRP